jgi:subtilisin family serine protease
VQNPPGIYDAAYSVGALNNGTDTIASFSSRGPVTSDGSMRMKPDIAAPGTNVRSAYNTSNTSYAFLSGTSMATPHVAGAVALLWSAHPELKNDITDTENILNASAHHILTSECTGTTPVTPNNVYGNGRLDILAAVNSVQSMVTLQSAASVKMQGAQSFAIPLALTGDPGVECRASRGVETLVFTFSGPIMNAHAAVTSGVGHVASTALSGNILTVGLTKVTDVQKITVTLSNITSDSAPAIPDVSVSMNVLTGDVNASKTVDNTDVTVTRGQVGKPVTTANFRDDVNADGAINANDVKVVRGALGHTLP